MIKFLHFNNQIPKRMSQRLKKKYQSRTVAAQPATPEEIRALARDFVNVDPATDLVIYQLRIGVTTLHPNDRYSKKVGRETASLKMEDIPLNVVSILLTRTHIFVRLQTFKGMDLNLRLNKDSNFSTITGQMSGDDE